MKRMFDFVKDALRDLFFIWREELKSVFKDEGVLIFFFLVPLAYPVLYSFIYNNEVVHEAKLVVVDADGSPLSREFIRRVDAASEVKVVQRAADMDEARRWVDSLKCPDRKRTLARHTDSLPLHRLLADSHRLLADEGSLHLILPFSQRERLQEVAFHEGLFMNRETHVYPTPTSQPKRLLVSLSRQRQGTLPTRLTIEQEPRCYTEEFATLVAPFYL